MSEAASTPAGIAVDPGRVPVRKLGSGGVMPGIGLGTFGSDHTPPNAVGQAVLGAARVGYRHFDCASVYGNEPQVGQALRQVVSDGIARREELFVTSKLWNDKQAPRDVAPQCQTSLRDLQLDYLDLYLIHWPFPNHHPPGCDVSARNEHARPYIHEAYMATWGELEKLQRRGLVRDIGTSNMTVPKLELLLRDAHVPPAVNEMELHPHFQQPALFDYCVSRGIQPVGYSPIGSPARPERDRTPQDTSPVEDPVIRQIAEAHDLHPATLCVKWGQQRGQVPIPFSTNPRNYAANLQAVTTPPLSDEEMRRIAEIDRNCRLIKGQVFLWKAHQDWRDLWDEDGIIRQ